MKLLAVVCQTAAAIAALALVSMTLLTVADVFLSNLLRSPIIGAYDIVETAMAFAVFLGLPEVFRREGNVTVDLVDHFATNRVVAVARFAGGLVTAAFAAVMAYAMLGPATDVVRYGDIKADAHIPLIVLWTPAFIGMALAAVSALLVLVGRTQKADST